MQMRQPHIWGGEPELLMSSHVLQMPITVYMREKKSGSLKTIAEYGQDYGKENPIRVLYHGYGHYDALQSPFCGQQSKLEYKIFEKPGFLVTCIVGLIVSAYEK
ncbi:hypothetical protein HHK36_015793 [Tetracentron sinense]|uniref:Ubiquitin thioesterase OTU n=1 Tax=Tetracentron sinense TaxID=13715 RepID=A0A834Z7V0_TETSI|nr:hypothetical protein HHK36_015793 [Tetracentron sinense]